MIRARFAPSPTGDLHVGSASSALASWIIAKRADGVNVLRIEDIDTPRVVRGATERIVEDLRWLGLDWDEGPDRGGAFGPYVQSSRISRYADAIDSLDRRGLVYPCDCSRAEIAAQSEASAPHGEELVYPGTCRDRDPLRAMKRPPALRLRVPDDATITFEDGVMGTVSEVIRERCGDFVLQRGDGLYAYHLAVSVDDLAMEITDVVRGADLLSSTARQISLMKTLDPAARVPRYSHVPLVRAPDGARLAKRDPRAVIRDLRASGVAPEALLGVLAHALAIAPDPSPRSALEIADLARETEVHFPREPIAWDSSRLFVP